MAGAGEVRWLAPGTLAGREQGQRAWNPGRLTTRERGRGSRATWARGSFAGRSLQRARQRLNSMPAMPQPSMAESSQMGLGAGQSGSLSRPQTFCKSICNMTVSNSQGVRLL